MQAEFMVLDIIVADDDPVVRHILGSVLRAGGHSLEEHPSGAALLEALDSRSAVPDLLFLDLQLGDMTGADVLPHVRKKFGATTRVIILSANSVDETKQLFPELEADDYLEKPFPPTRILEILKGSNPE